MAPRAVGSPRPLPAWRKTQLEERRALGHRADENGIVFSALEGGPTHPDLFSQIFDRAVAKSSLPRIRLHDLRRTHASIVLKKGARVKVVSEHLGHSNPAFTMAVYQHVLPGMQMQTDAERRHELGTPLDVGEDHCPLRRGGDRRG